MIAALLALFAWFAAHLSPVPAAAAPAAAVVVTSQVGGPVTPSGSARAPAAPLVDVDERTCLAGEEWDGLRCVALQLPEETTGRQYDPAD